MFVCVTLSLNASDKIFPVHFYVRPGHIPFYRRRRFCTNVHIATRKGREILS